MKFPAAEYTTALKTQEEASGCLIIECCRTQWLDLADRFRILFKNRRGNADLVLPLERALSCRHLVEHCAEGEDI